MNEYQLLYTTIVTERRTDDWIAFIKHHKENWEAGKTEAEAIGKLVMNPQSLVAVEIRTTNAMKHHCCTADGSCHTGQHIGGKCGPGCSEWEGEEE